MSEIKLKSCPFCGGEAEIQYGACDYNVYQAVCKEQNCHAMSGWSDTPEEAAEAWNKRAAGDYAPVVHGRWVHSPSPYDKRDDFWFCSECGRTINIICGDKLLSNYPYCHCGAKMDGGDTDV